MAKLLYMIINTANMTVAQLGALDTICAKQFLEDPEAPIDTAPVSFGGSYSCYSKEQMTTLAVNCGIDATGKEYGDLIDLVRKDLAVKYKAQEALKSEEFYESKLKQRMAAEPELYAKFEPVLPDPVTKPVSSKPKVSGATSTVTRPAGGTTKRVWELADAIRLENGNLDAKSLRPKIIAACEADGINSSTAGTQFAKWKNSINWN